LRHALLFVFNNDINYSDKSLIILILTGFSPNKIYVWAIVSNLQNMSKEKQDQT